MKTIRNTILGGITFLCTSLGGYAQSEVQSTFFPYPTVPENLETLTERSNFFIDNFWKR